MAAELLRRCVDCNLKDVSWMRLAKWLPVHPTLKCYGATMQYGGKTCATQALSIYVGARVPALPRKPSTEDVCATAASMSKPIALLYNRPLDTPAADRCLLFGTVPEEGGSVKSGHRGCLIPIKTAGGQDVRPMYKNMNRILGKAGLKRMILIVFNSALYPAGHCLVVSITKKAYVLSDPFMPAGTCLVLPSKEALLLLMCSATTILGH